MDSRRIRDWSVAAVAGALLTSGVVHAGGLDSSGEVVCKTRAGYLRISSSGECRRSEVPVELPQGAEGPQGEQGPQGERGPAGIGGNASVGIGLVDASGHNWGQPAVAGLCDTSGATAAVKDGQFVCLGASGIEASDRARLFDDPTCSHQAFLAPVDPIPAFIAGLGNVFAFSGRTVSITPRYFAEYHFDDEMAEEWWTCSEISEVDQKSAVYLGFDHATAVPVVPKPIVLQVVPVVP